MQSLEYQQIIAEIESLGIMPDRPPSLEPMNRALEVLMPDPSHWRPNKTVVVAGTNGKGSVCATLEALFLATGETVGLYTSPHLEDTTERIRINGAQLTEDQFCKIYSEIKSKLSGMILTHFETLTLMAAWAFFSGHHGPPVDRAIFEVGLGGKWDATNAIPHHHSIITQLGYDHQKLLGDSISEIASNKFGIVKNGSVVVHSALPIEAKTIAEETQKRTQSTWIPSVSVSHRVETQDQEPRFHMVSPWGEAQLALPGRRGAENSATALTYFHHCGYDPSLYLSQLTRVQWNGRMERWNSPDAPCPIYLSGDHNPQGIQSLLELLNHYKRNHLHILIGIGIDKNRDEIFSPLFSLKNASILITETPFKPLAIESYGRWLELSEGNYTNPLDGLQAAFKRASCDDIILVTGSLYLVGLIRKALRAAA